LGQEHCLACMRFRVQSLVLQKGGGVFWIAFVNFAHRKVGSGHWVDLVNLREF
jgi:hypothetical protein